MKTILVVGIGNIFFGDDAFGVEVVRELPGHELPPEVRVKDFGIRGFDLAYELGNGYDAAILVDAVPRGEAPGTVCLIELDLANLRTLDRESLDAHGMDPVRVLQMAETLGGRPAQIYLVGCEPGKLDSEDGQMGLSSAVQAAVPKAIEMIQSLVAELLQPQTKLVIGVMPA
jgi:hydrogenase maturation protease